MRYVTTAALALMVLQGCGGGSSGGSSSSAPTPSPAPAPAPAPVPVPGPTPTPSPTLAADPGGAMLARATLPGELYGLAVCASGSVVRTNGRITALTETGPGGRVGDTQFGIVITSDYEYRTDFNGFGGSVYPSSRRTGGRAFEVFVSAQNDDELQIAKPLTPLTYMTYGLASYDLPCFFAAGSRSSSPPASVIQTYSTGFGDGLVRTGSDYDRLYGTRATLVRVAGQTYQLTIDLAAVADAFADPEGQAVRLLGRMTVQVTLNQGGFTLAQATAPGGFVGEVRGVHTGEGLRGAGFAFDLVNPAGERLWGVVALDGDAS